MVLWKQERRGGDPPVWGPAPGARALGRPRASVRGEIVSMLTIFRFTQKNGSAGPTAPRAAVTSDAPD
jgi:hypothetical protein